MEQIYTIPVNEVFDACARMVPDADTSDTDARKVRPASETPCLCPICRLFGKLNEAELDRILGAAMMEPDVRIQTNKQGFCLCHYREMLTRKNRLGLALMTESHLAELKKDLRAGALTGLVRGAGHTPVRRLTTREADCYLCRRIEGHLAPMIDTVIELYCTDPAFRQKMKKQSYYCLPHFRRLAARATEKLSRRENDGFYRTIEETELAYLDKLGADITHFCRKFDYRYENEPWNDAKDAVERAVFFLRGTEEPVE